MRSVSLLIAAAVACAPAFGQFTPIATPTADYLSFTTAVPVAGMTVSSLTAGVQTLSFSSPMTVFAVGSGWNFWGSPPNTESSTPNVVATTQNSLTITLSSPAPIFGFEIEPANVGGMPPAPFTISATFYNGSTVLGTVTRSVLYNAAVLEAATSSVPITSVQISAASGAGGFAIAQLRSGSPPAGVMSVPALGTGALAGLALLLAAAGSMLARSRGAVRT